MSPPGTDGTRFNSITRAEGLRWTAPWTNFWRAQAWGLALMVGGIHRFDNDPSVKPSIGAVGGFYSENKSWGLTAMEMARLGGDTSFLPRGSGALGASNGTSAPFPGTGGFEASVSS